MYVYCKRISYFLCQTKLKQEQEEKEREILAEKQAALQKKREETKLAKQVVHRYSSQMQSKVIMASCINLNCSCSGFLCGLEVANILRLLNRFFVLSVL